MQVSTETPLGESGTSPDSPLLEERAERYYELIFSVFVDKPVFRNPCNAASHANGTVDGDEFAKSLKMYRSLLEEESEAVAHEQRRNNIITGHSRFPVTDYTEPVHSAVIEAGAALIYEMINEHCTFLRKKRFPKPNLLISLGQRGSGALAHAVASHLDIPYALSNWYPEGSRGDVEVARCEGACGMGGLYVNSIGEDSVVAIVLDAIYTAASVTNLVKAVQAVRGATIIGIYSLARMVYKREALFTTIENVPIWSVVNVDLNGEITTVSRTTPNSSLAFPIMCPPLKLLPSSTLNVLKRLPQAEVQRKLRNVSASFCGVPVVSNTEVSYPYCNFSVTDFKPAVSPALIEDVADLAVHFGDFGRCDVLVSDGERGSGPLIQAISVRTNLPYVITNWTLFPNSSQTAPRGPFKGSHSLLALRGVQSGMRCILVDDMLCSGGTAEAILECIRLAGAHAVEAVFASEKLYREEGRRLPVRKGKERLDELFPETVVTCLVQFVMGSSKSEEPPSRIGD